MLIKKEKYRDIFYLSLFYLLAQGGVLLIPNAIFWDDWVLYEVRPDIILDMFHQSGSMFNLAGYMHNALLYFGPWIYKVLTFILMLGSGMFLYFIIMPIKKISQYSRFLIVLLFLILPLYIARIALIDIGYTICYFLFFMAWYFRDSRVIALPIFFLSFNTNSLLVFYAVPIAYMFYEEGLRLNVKSVLIFLWRKIDYLLLPFVYFWIKVTWFKPYGNYVGYNESYSIKNLFISPFLQAYNFFYFQVNIVLVTILSVIAFIILRKYTRSVEVKKEQFMPFILVGLFCLLFGLIPYWVLGHVPSFVDWSSRHQLLMPLGLAILVLGIILTLGDGSLKAGCISLIIGFSLTVNISNYYDIYMDWDKQKTLLMLFANNEIIRDANLIVFNDKTTSSNALSRTYRFYEWNGLMKKTFGDEKRYGISNLQLAAFNSGAMDSTFTSSNNASEFMRAGNLKLACIDIVKSANADLYNKFRSKVFPRYELISKECNSAYRAYE